VHEETRILSKRFDEDTYEIVAEMTEGVAKSMAQYGVAL
jgi:hypothetical protein